MATDLFYFSGTGNSYFVAQELARRLTQVHLRNLVHPQKEGGAGQADTLGLVFPIYGFTAPAPVFKFLKNLDLKSYGHIFAVATKGGSPDFCVPHLSKILKKQKKRLDAYFEVPLPNNSHIIHDLASDERIQQQMAAAQPNLDKISEALRRQEKVLPKMDFGGKKTFLRAFGFLAKISHFGGFDKKFSVNEKCTSCGVCEKVCPSGKVSLKEGKPVWDKTVSCFYCTACLNYCPLSAITNGTLKPSATQPSNRYTNPQVKLNEMVKNNNKF